MVPEISSSAEQLHQAKLGKRSDVRQLPSEKLVRAQMQLFKPLNVSVSERRNAA